MSLLDPRATAARMRSYTGPSSKFQWQSPELFWGLPTWWFHYAKDAIGRESFREEELASSFEHVFQLPVNAGNLRGHLIYLEKRVQQGAMIPVVVTPA